MTRLEFFSPFAKRPAHPVQHPSSAAATRWAPLQQLLLPGLAPYRAGYHRAGLAGILVSSLVYLAIASIGVAFLTSRHIVLALATTSSAITGVIVAAIAVSLVLFGYGAYTIVLVARRGRHSSRMWVGILAGIVVASQLAAVGIVVVTLDSYRTLLDSLFASSPAASSGAAGAAGTPGAGFSGGGAGPLTAQPGAAAKAAPIAGRYNILLLGGDAGAGRWGLRPDSISVVSVDATTGAISVIGIPRNLEKAPFVAGSPLYGPYPNGYDCGVQCLVSFLYTYGSGHPQLYSDPSYGGRDPGVLAERDAVEGVLGLRIDNTVLVDMAAFGNLVDAVGGVTITIPHRFLAQDDKTWFEAGTQHLTGAQALLYSRTRYDSNDYVRMTRQRQIQTALVEQANPFALLLGFQKIASTGARYVSTDIPQSELAEFAGLAIDSRSQPVRTLELSPPLVNVVNPDFAGIHTRVAAFIAGR